MEPSQAGLHPGARRGRAAGHLSAGRPWGCLDLDAGDLHFVCDGSVGSAESHAELHMHGVHFRRTGDIVSIWMDMTKDGKISFQTS